MANMESKIIEEKSKELESKEIEYKEEAEFRKRFFGAVDIYIENEDAKEPKLKQLRDYAANIVADGFIKYSGDEVGEITLGVVMDDVVKHKELVDMISKKAEKAGVNVSLGEYTKKYNEKNNKNNNKGISVSK